MVNLGDRFKFPHPVSGKDEIFEAINVLGPQVELKAVTGDYPNDLARTVSAFEVDIRRHRLLTDDELKLLKELSESARGQTITGNKSHNGLIRLVDEKLVMATAVSVRFRIVRNH